MLSVPSWSFAPREFDKRQINNRMREPVVAALPTSTKNAARSHVPPMHELE